MTTTPQPELPQGDSHQATPPPPQQPYQQPAAGQPHPGQPVSYSQQHVLDPAQQRQWGMLSHLIGLAAMIFSAGVAGFVGSLIVYLLFRERGDFVRKHAANSLNVQIIAGVGNLIAWFLIFTLIGAIVGIPLLIAVNVWAFVVHIIGAMKANKGELWDPPMAYPFVK